MSLGAISSQRPVLQAIAEFDRLGRQGFLDKYGFGKARDYFVEYAGRRYDSKAIVGAAHGYAVPGEGPLRPQDFSGGEVTVARLLRGLGFDVTSPSGKSHALLAADFSGARGVGFGGAD